MVSYIPEGTRTVTPHLVITGATKAIEFYARAFGAQELYRMRGPEGSVAHAELQIGDSRVYVADEWPGGNSRSPRSLKGSSVVLHVYVPDVDAAIQRAAAAGAKVVMPAMDMFWGDRYGQVSDPFGHLWALATHKEDLTPDEMIRRNQEFIASMPPPQAAKKAAARKPAARKPARPKKSKGKGRRKRG